MQDCSDRPGDKAKRKVLLVVECEPALDKETGALDTVHTRFKVRASIPDRQSKPYPMTVTNDGLLHFQSNSPMDPRQDDLPFRPEMEARSEFDEDEQADTQEM